MADEMPSYILARDHRRFRQSFLYAIFSEVTRASVDCALNRRRVERLRDGYESYLFSLSICASSSPLDSLLHAG
jgi:hypothetical protein